MSLKTTSSTAVLEGAQISTLVFFPPLAGPSPLSTEDKLMLPPRGRVSFSSLHFVEASPAVSPYNDAPATIRVVPWAVRFNAPAKNTETIPKMVRVLPVPGGPCNKDSDDSTGMLEPCPVWYSFSWNLLDTIQIARS